MHHQACPHRGRAKQHRRKNGVVHHEQDAARAAQGADAGEVMANFTDISALPERLMSDPPDRLGPEHGNAWSQAMQAFFLDQTDEAQTKEILQQLWMDGAMQQCVEQEYDWCPAQ